MRGKQIQKTQFWLKGIVFMREVEKELKLESDNVNMGENGNFIFFHSEWLY